VAAATVTLILGLRQRDWTWVLVAIFVFAFGNDVTLNPINAWRAAGLLPVLWAFGPGYEPPMARRSAARVTDFMHVEGEVDYVLNFASPASPTDYLRWPIHTLKVGAFGTHKGLGLALEKSATFFLASTSEVYGDPQVNPQPETYWGNVNPIGPRGVYDEAKRFAEALTLAYNREHGLDTRIVRIFNTYGPKMRPNDGRAIPAYFKAAIEDRPLPVFGDGTQTRSLCYVDDEVEGILRLLLSAETGPVNIGNPEEVTMLELAEAVQDVVGNHPGIEFHPLPVDDPMVRRPDTTKAEELLGWKAQISLREGLERTLPWFLEVLGA